MNTLFLIMWVDVIGLAILFFVTPFCIVYFLKKISRLEESIEKLHETILDQKLTPRIRD
ncbi:hypothetical protein [Vibrio lentus]|uniref:hypothetical protein n=1 Tax=Vibrio lentus TaxID=136468 RepID=UPI0012FFEFF0|nr:hypothetical protein [Vibrio lentus]